MRLHPTLLLVACLLLAGCTGGKDADSGEDLGVVDAGHATTDPDPTDGADDGSGGAADGGNESEDPEVGEGTPFALTPELVAVLESRNATFPSWRPDGAALAWYEWPDGNATAGKIVFHSLSSGVFRTMTGPKFWGSHIAWNPAGTKVAVAFRDGDTYIGILDIGSDRRDRLSGTIGATPFQWIDEGILAVSNRTGKSEVYLYHENGTLKRQVTNDSEWKWAPHAKSDAQVPSRNEFVVLVAEEWSSSLAPFREPVGKVARYDLATGQLKRFVRSDGDYSRPVWRTPTEIAYLAAGDGTMHLSDADGFERRDWARMDAYSFTGGGETLAYSPCGDGVHDICMINFLTATGTS